MAFPHQDTVLPKGFSFQSLLSDPKYSIFDFAPGETHTISTEEDRLMAGHLTDILMVTFLDKINFEFEQPIPNKQVHTDLKVWTDKNMIPLCGNDIYRIKAVTAAMYVGASISDYFFPYADHRARLLIAIASTAGISLDDFVGDTEHGRFQTFATDLMMGKPISDGWLGMYTRMMREYISYFGEEDPRPGALGGEFLIKFLSSMAEEDRFSRPDTLPPHLCPTRDPHGCCPEGFPYWHRYQSGASGAYIPPLFHSVPFDYWITSLPHLVRFTNFSNDLLSFHKEILAGGELDMNYMSLQVLARRQACVPSRFGTLGSLWTYRDAICEVMDETYQTVYELDKAFIEFPKYVAVCSSV
jgi:hypothetical protein